MTRTYIDSGVLIAAARGDGRLSERALAILSDEDREFISSDYVRLETVPKPAYFGRVAELRLYEEYFSTVAQWFTWDVAHWSAAFATACAFGLSPLESTTAVHRVTGMRIVSIDV